MGPALATTVPSLLPLQATSVITAVTQLTTMALINRPAWFTSSIVCPCCAASNAMWSGDHLPAVEVARCPGRPTIGARRKLPGLDAFAPGLLRDQHATSGRAST